MRRCAGLTLLANESGRVTDLATVMLACRSTCFPLVSSDIVDVCWCGTNPFGRRAPRGPTSSAAFARG